MKRLDISECLVVSQQSHNQSQSGDLKSVCSAQLLH